MNLLFIGGGNMASALIGGLSEGKTAVNAIHVIDPSTSAQEKLSARLATALRARGVSFSMDASDCPASIADQAEKTWVVLAVKPQQMQAACTDAKPNVRTVLQKAHILSIAAGITTKTLSGWCANEKIVRAMPNTPSLVNHGITGIFAGSAISERAKKHAEQLMASVGHVVWIDNESLMDAVTALSGSGPAYVYRFVEALTEGAAALGLTHEQAQLLAVQTIEGALLLLKTSGETPRALREKVTSKGGTTASALAVLDEKGFASIIESALKAARDRGQEMSREFR